jgi:hypothetical protein
MKPGSSLSLGKRLSSIPTTTARRGARVCRRMRVSSGSTLADRHRPAQRPKGSAPYPNPRIPPTRPVHRTTPWSEPRLPPPRSGRRSLRCSRTALWTAPASRLKWSKVGRRRRSTCLPMTGARAVTASQTGSRAVAPPFTRSYTASSPSASACRPRKGSNVGRADLRGRGARGNIETRGAGC